MTEQEIMQIAEVAKAKIDQAVKEAVEQISPQRQMRWKPKLNEYYYCWRESGNTNYYAWNDDKTDARLFREGNCFRTEQEAIEGRKKQSYQRQYRAMGRPYKPNQENWIGFYNHRRETPCVDIGRCGSNCAVVCFDSRKDCQAAIDEIGYDSFLKYVLEVDVTEENLNV